MRGQFVGAIANLVVVTGCLAEDESVRIDDREAAVTAAALVDKNIELENRVAQLKEQIKELTLRLAESTAHSDRIEERARKSGPRIQSNSGSDIQVAAATVVDVCEELNLVVLNAGAEAGVRNGVRFVLTRNGHPVADAEARDVRRSITGAVVLSVRSGPYPARGDHAIVSR